MSRWTLRTRLVAGLLAIFALLSAVIGFASLTALRHQTMGQLDRQLSDSVQRTVHGRPMPGAMGGGQDDDLFVPGQTVGTVVVAVAGGQVNDSGVLQGGYDSQTKAVFTRITAAARAVLLAVPADGKPHSVTLSGLGRYRVVAMTTGPTSRVVVGLPLAAVDATCDSLAIVIGIAAGAGLIGAAVLGSLIVRVTLRPLRRVAETASRVSELPLAQGAVVLPERVRAADTDPRTEVGQVGSALNRMLGHVETALAARHDSETRVRQFVADASHELRTPLAAIRGYAELTRRTSTDLPPPVAYAMARVESEATRMTGLVQDLLLLARLDSGRPLEQEPVDLTAALIDAVSDAHAAGPDHPVSLVLPADLRSDDEVLVVGDAARLHQVLTNLLSNTRTHTPPGTRVAVELRREPGTAVITVRDDGPGIPPDLLPHVFERFARADNSRSRQAGSTGLGLAIVQAVVSAHDGRVEVDSGPGRTVFTVRLPALGASPADRSLTEVFA
jgi:two-component system, OmpR family, sensor kinase